jgi:hypothetical protein
MIVSKHFDICCLDIYALNGFYHFSYCSLPLIFRPKYICPFLFNLLHKALCHGFGGFIHWILMCGVEFRFSNIT